MKRSLLKKVLCSILLLCLCVVFSFAVIHAEEGECPYTYTFDEESSALRIYGTGVLDPSLFSEELAQYAWFASELYVCEGFTAVAESSFVHSALRKVVLADSVTEIRDGAFMWSHNLQSLTLSKNLKSIGGSTFTDTSLVSVELPEQLVSIGDSAFSANLDLVSVNIPDSVKEIGEAAFTRCSDELKFDISPEHPYFTVDEQGIFCDKEMTVWKLCMNPELTEATVPASVRKIECEAFSGNGKLTKVNFSEGLTEIGRYCFSACTALEKVELPDSLRSIGASAFNSCFALREVSIPKNIRLIGESAFAYLESLEKVTFTGAEVSGEADGMIQYRAFANCCMLEEIRIPASIAIIGDWAFEDCYNMTYAELSDSVTELGERAFYGCQALRSVVLSDGITAISESCFELCWELATVKFPGKLVSIGDSAFADTALEEVRLPETVISIGERAFSGCRSMKVLELPESLQTMGAYAFEACEQLPEVKIPGSLETIAASAFERCTAMTKLTICEGTKNIEPYALYMCSSLNELSIADSVENMGESVFYDCDALTTVKLPAKLTVIPERLFYSCYNLQTVDLPEAVVSIEAGAFDSCRHLRNIDLPEGLKKIGDDAFNFCKRMETIVIPSTVESIGNRAFMDCIALKSVYFKGDAPLIGAYPFHSYYGFVNVQELRVLPELTLYYPYLGANWWEPEWHGYPTVAWSGEFVDVDYYEYYVDAVLWAVDEGITNGTGELRFSPDLGCTRGQIVTFLWRAAGCPEPESTENPFTDVRKKDYYYKAVLWAVEQGITKGMGKGRFAPNETCTRAQAVTFLWRFDGKPDFSDWDMEFADVPENSYYEQAIIWAYWYDITNGVDSDHFAPDEECTRGQIVTFLYRYMT